MTRGNDRGNDFKSVLGLKRVLGLRRALDWS